MIDVDDFLENGIDIATIVKDDYSPPRMFPIL